MPRPPIATWRVQALVVVAAGAAVSSTTLGHSAHVGGDDPPPVVSTPLGGTRTMVRPGALPGTRPTARRIEDLHWVAAWEAGGTRDDALFGVPRELLPHAAGVLVLDPGSLELLSFDREARLRWHTGRQGSGPGEFARPVDLARLPDGGTAVLDPGNGRLALFDSAGRFQRHVTAPGLANASALCATADRRFHVTQPGAPRAVLTLDATGTVVATHRFPWPVPVETPSFLRAATFARGPAGTDCLLATLHGFGLARVGGAAPVATWPYVAQVPAPTLEQRRQPDGRVATIMTAGTIAARAAFRSGDTTLVDVGQVDGRWLLDRYGPDGRYLGSWQVPGSERLAYANRRLYTLDGGHRAPRLMVWVPAADTAGIRRR